MSAGTRDGGADRHGPSMTRRGLIKTVGLSVGTAATVGAGSQIDELDPVGEADAIGTLTAIAVGAAGVYVYDHYIEGDTGVDETDSVEDQAYNVGLAVQQGRSDFIKEMNAQYSVQTGKSPYANAAWQELRAQTVSAFANGEPESTAETNSIQGLNVQTSQAVINMVERWNTGIEGLMEALVLDKNNSAGVFQAYGSSGTIGPATEADLNDHWSPVEASQVDSGGYLVWESTAIDLPASVDEVDQRDEPLSILGIAMGTDGVAAPNIQNFGADNYNSYNSALTPLKVTHTDLSDKTVFDTGEFNGYFSQISTEYQNITDDLSTFVTNLYEQLEEDQIDASEVLSSRDIAEQFSSEDSQSRFAAEMVAIGADVPDDSGYEAKVSHPDLQSDSKWGQLYLRYTDPSADNTTPAPGATISSAEYDIAYFGFHSANADEYRRRILSGSGQDLQVLDVAGLPDEQSVEEGYGSAADQNSDVVIYEGEDPPDPIQYPADHTEWTVSIQGASTTSTHSPSEVSVDGNTYTITGTSLNAGESVEGVRLVPPTNYSRPVEHVADPTNPDDGETAERMKTLQQTVDDLETDLGGGGGIGFPSIGGLGQIGTAAVGAVVLVFLIVVAAVASFASAADPRRRE